MSWSPSRPFLLQEPWRLLQAGRPRPCPELVKSSQSTVHDHDVTSKDKALPYVEQATRLPVEDNAMRVLQEEQPLTATMVPPVEGMSDGSHGSKGYGTVHLSLGWSLQPQFQMIHRFTHLRRQTVHMQCPVQR